MSTTETSSSIDGDYRFSFTNLLAVILENVFKDVRPGITPHSQRDRMGPMGGQCGYRHISKLCGFLIVDPNRISLVLN